MSKIVVITGGSRGLGLTTTKILLSHGYQVIVVSRAESKELKAIANDNLIFKSHDLFDLKGIHKLCNQLNQLATDQFGGNVYGLINNAAIGSEGVLGTMHETDISRTLAINVQAPLLLSKYISRQMMLFGIKGRIINVGSIIATTGYSGLSVYAASKSALEGFTRSLARELGKFGITVNLVAPGFLDTDMTARLTEDQVEKIKRRSALGELSRTESVAHTIQFLLTEHASSITGTVSTVDGGATA